MAKKLNTTLAPQMVKIKGSMTERVGDAVECEYAVEVEVLDAGNLEDFRQKVMRAAFVVRAILGALTNKDEKE